MAKRQLYQAVELSARKEPNTILEDMSDELDNDEIRNCIRDTFVKFIDPNNIMWMFHRYDTQVLTENDLQRVKAKISTDGRMEGAQLLLNLLPSYKGWFPCLIQVLQDENVKLGHVAETIQGKVNNLKNSKLGERKKSTHQDDCLSPQSHASVSNADDVTSLQEQADPSEVQLTDIDLLLIGKTGTGKSAIGNSILGFEAFKSESSSTSVTTDTQFNVAKVQGKNIKVVDGPGVGDTRKPKEEFTEQFVNCMKHAIACNPEGYHAFILVVAFGGRFTEEDCMTIDVLKKIFGKDFVRKYCIVGMSHGDNFQKESKKKNKTFKQWCAEQTGVFNDLMKECNERVVLFNNATTNKEKQEKQSNELITMVNNLSIQGQRYTDETFKEANRLRETLIVEAKVPVLNKKIIVETSSILQEFKALQADEPENTDRLETLYERTTVLYNTLLVEDRETGCLRTLIGQAEELKTTVANELSWRRTIQSQSRGEQAVAKRREDNDGFFATILSFLMSMWMTIVEYCDKMRSNVFRMLLIG